MEYRIVALDPGGTTGWATYTADKILSPEGDFEYLDEKFACGQLGPEEHHQQLFIFLGQQQTQEFVVVCESFEFRNNDRRQRDNINLMSREYIGVTKLFFWDRMDHLDQKLRFQTAAMGKGFVSDEKIKSAGLWHPNHRHAMDAYRHLLYHLVNRDNRHDLVRRWWR